MIEINCDDNRVPYRRMLIGRTATKGFTKSEIIETSQLQPVKGL